MQKVKVKPRLIWSYARNRELNDSIIRRSHAVENPSKLFESGAKAVVSTLDARHLTEGVDNDARGRNCFVNDIL